MLKLFCTETMSVLSTFANIGIAGKYISIANGDTAMIDDKSGSNHFSGNPLWFWLVFEISEPSDVFLFADAALDDEPLNMVFLEKLAER